MRGMMSDGSVNVHLLKAEAEKRAETAKRHESNVTYWKLALQTLLEERAAGRVAPIEFRDKKRDYTVSIRMNTRAAAINWRESEKLMKRYRKAMRKLWDIP